MLAAPIIVAYFAAWSIYSRSYFVADIPGNKITHINYAFANIGSNGLLQLGDSWADVEKAFPGDTWEQPLRGNFNQLLKLKQKYPHLQTLISIGGWTWSGRFSDVALTPASRTRFAQSCMKFVQDYGFDGVDLDWEYPVSGGLAGNTNRPEDKQNYVLLLEQLREQLDVAGDSDGKRYLLTVATGAGTERIDDMDLPSMSNYLDFINVMTYDFHGGWEEKTGHNAPLYKNDAETASDSSPSFIKSKYNIHAAIQAYISAGTPRSKLVLGLPLYGRGWQGVMSTAQNGFSQAASRQLPRGTWENGVFDYDDLKKTICRVIHAIGMIYDDLQSIGIKNEYIKQEQLAGAMFWELSSDRNAELVGSTFAALSNGHTFAPVTTRSTTLNTNAPQTTTVGSTSSETTTETQTGDIFSWGPNKPYSVGDRVTFEENTYQCIQSHTSLSNWTPVAVPALWQLF